MTHGNSRVDPTAELDMRRINVRTKDDIVVDFTTG
jgi:hypothetical protein